MKAIVCLFSIVIPLCVACTDNRMDDRDLPEPSRFGVAETEEFPAVVKVLGSGFCSGAILSPKVVLTASHCLRGSGTGMVATPRGRFSAIAKRQLGPGVENDPHDIALLFFDEKISGNRPEDTLWLGDSVSVGDTVRLIGYGCNSRRTGTNVVYQIDDYIELLAAPDFPQLGQKNYHIRGPSNRASTCHGDSGSPLLKETPYGWRIVGILHAEIRDGSRRYSAYIDVTHGENREFIRNALDGR